MHGQCGEWCHQRTRSPLYSFVTFAVHPQSYRDRPRSVESKRTIEQLGLIQLIDALWIQSINTVRWKRRSWTFQSPFRQTAILSEPPVRRFLCSSPFGEARTDPMPSRYCKPQATCCYSEPLEIANPKGHIRK